MRVTLIFTGSTGAGPVYSLEMAKALAQSGNCELQIIISEGVSNLPLWKDAFEGTQVQLNVVKTYQHSSLSVFLQFFNYRRKYKILRLIKAFRPDVLYVPFGFMWARFVFALLPTDIRIVYTIHDVAYHDWFNYKEKFSLFLTAGSRKFVNGYIVLNRKDKPIVEEKYKKPVVVIPHASFSYYFDHVDNTPKNQLNKCVGFFGRIEPYKGLDLLVSAFEKTKTQELKLLIAGSGTINSELANKIKGNSNIELINRYIKDEEFHLLLDKVDFVVLPYKRASQSGVIPMCFAYGKTVIATNVGALREQIPDGTGILTEPDDNMISQQMDNMYENANLIFEYGRNAKQYAITELTWSRSSTILLQFAETLKNKRNA